MTLRVTCEFVAVPGMKRSVELEMGVASTIIELKEYRLFGVINNTCKFNSTSQKKLDIFDFVAMRFDSHCDVCHKGFAAKIAPHDAL